MTDQNETAPEQTEEAEDITPTDEEWAQRILCSDGNCIGVIGPDGRCKECGKPYEGDLPAAFDAAPGLPEEKDEDEDEEDTEVVADSGEDAETGEAEDPPAGLDDDWENRILCSDGNCIGVIGPDGRCKECGKPYEGEHDASGE